MTKTHTIVGGAAGTNQAAMRHLIIVKFRRVSESGVDGGPSWAIARPVCVTLVWEHPKEK